MKHKSIKHIPNKLNSNFLSTERGQKEYDDELARLQENRRRFANYIKEKGTNTNNQNRREY